MPVLAEQSVLPDSQSTLLSPISWQTDESLLKDLDGENRIRLIYHQGNLEIVMSPLLPLHEICSTLIHN
jgi:Uma2 family endonuclease